MNIKVKNVTFEKAMAIQPPKRKKLRKPSRLFQTLVRILSIPELCGAKFSYVKEDIEKAVKEAEKFAQEDKKRKEEVETRNNADSLVYAAISRSP